MTCYFLIGRFLRDDQFWRHFFVNFGMQSPKRYLNGQNMVTFRPKHPEWDRTRQFTPLSKMMSIYTRHFYGIPPPRLVTFGFILPISHRSPSYFSLTLSNFSTYLLNSKNRICLSSKTARKPKKHWRNYGRQLSKRKIECKNSITVNFLLFVCFFLFFRSCSHWGWISTVA